MNKTFAAALLVAASAAHAGDWTFTLKDLRSDGIFGSGGLVSVRGSFSGADNNSDGFITTDELTNLFVWDDFQAYPFHHVGLDETNRPYDTGFASIRFNVATGQMLDLSAGSFNGVTGYRMSLLGAFQCDQFCLGATWEDGVSSVVVTAKSFPQDVSPVPEPETYALLLAGLITLSAAGLRRRARVSGS